VTGLAGGELVAGTSGSRFSPEATIGCCHRVGLGSEGRCYPDLVKRLLFALAIGYVVLALVSRAREAAGLLTCSCYPDCWCKKPGLSLFRWVFPRFHDNPEIEAWIKQRIDPSA
jgi:hypothetical protein